MTQSQNLATKANNIKNIMKAKGLRITPQRYAVYANLLERQDHPTVEDIKADINQVIPIASTASIYGALAVLRQVGLVREVLLDEGITRYDARVEAHHHFICEQCRSIRDLSWKTFADLSLSELPQGWTASSYEITVKGICRVCHQKSTS